MLRPLSPLLFNFNVGNYVQIKSVPRRELCVRSECVKSEEGSEWNDGCGYLCGSERQRPWWRFASTDLTDWLRSTDLDLIWFV